MEKRGLTIRCVIAGAILSFCIGAGNVYNALVLKGSHMSLDFTTGSALFLMFALALGNLLVNRISPRVAFSPAELILIYVMMTVSCAIPTMGLTLYLVPLISGVRYYASDANEWNRLIVPHLKSSLFVNDPDAVNWFYEGLPPGKHIPWAAWLRPLALWLIVIMALYIVMILLMVLLRKQWVEKEKLNYPMTKAPLELIHSTSNRIFRNRLFWLAFAIPFVLGTMNALHSYQPLFPSVQMNWGTSVMRNTANLQFRISFPMIGFTYFVNSPLALSLWLFCVLTTLQDGFFKMVGFGKAVSIPYAHKPMLDFQSLGALLVVVGYGVWMSRQHLREMMRRALSSGDSGQEEIVSYRTAFWGTVAALGVMIAWILMSGLSPVMTIVFLFFALLIYVGITRVVVEGGLAATRAPVMAPGITTTLLGTTRMDAAALVPLAYTFVYASDVRTFVMASAANGLKMLEEVRKRRTLVFWGMLIAIIVTLVSSIWATLLLAYRHGAINAEQWFFVNGPQVPWRFIASHIKNPQPVNRLFLGFMGIGMVLAGFLQFMRTRFLWFPLHPLGLAFSTIYMTNQLWFSVFLAWLLKSVILKYGGAGVYESGKRFFIGLIFGQFAVSGLWLIIDFFAKHRGNVLFWA